MAWLKRKIVAWLLPEIQAQQASQIRAQIEISVQRHGQAVTPAALRNAMRRWG